MTNNLQEAALRYAEQGWAVLPLWEPRGGGCTCPSGVACKRPGKHPRTLHGLLDASLDPDQIRKWWERWPNANIGLLTEGWFIVDVDPRNDGVATLIRLEAEHGSLDAPCNLTGEYDGVRGKHYRYRQNGRPIAKGKLGPGIDIQANGGYIVAAPSMHVSGVQYEWEPGDEPVVPRWLEEALARGEVNGQETKPTFEELLANPPAKGERDPWVTKACGHLARKHRGDWNAYQDACLEKLWSLITDRDDYPVQEFQKTIGSIWKTDQGNTGNPLPDDGKPHINANEVAWVQAEETWRAIVRYNEPPHLFRSGGDPVRLETDDNDRPRLRPLTVDRLTHEVDRVATWVGLDKNDNEVKKNVPVPVVKRILGTPNHPLPVLVRMVAAPVFGRSGNVQTEPGYHRDSRTLYVPADGFEVDLPPEHPTDVDLAQALDWINELLWDFPFKDDASRAHAIALLLLPFMRDLIDGPTPLHLLRKPTPGTGASLLVSVLLHPILGQPPSFITGCNNDDEMRKRLTAIFREGPVAIPFDNLTGHLDSPHLAGALTALMWGDRILGVSDMGGWPVRAVWVASGNNLTLSDELVRRTALIHLDAGVAEPWNRSDWRHPDLPRWVEEHRSELVWSVLCAGRAWLSRGRPRGRVSRGSYEDWAAVMGGVLDVLEVPGFLTNSNELFQHADPERDSNLWLAENWWAKFKEDRKRASELLRGLEDDPDFPFDLGPDYGNGSNKRVLALGLHLSKIRGRVFPLEDGTQVRVGRSNGKIAGSFKWYLENSGGTPELAL